jgi:hypothetical protein
MDSAESGKEAQEAQEAQAEWVQLKKAINAIILKEERKKHSSQISEAQLRRIIRKTLL